MSLDVGYMKPNKSKYLRRYTSLPILFDMLINRRVTLVDPKSWEDRNDSYYLEIYQQKKQLKTLLALCFTIKPETFHHWKIFAGHPGGVCITFDKQLLLKQLLRQQNIRVEIVTYRLIKDLRENPPSIDELPFIKRKPYRDEGEFRIIYEDKKKEVSIKHFKIELSVIKKITLNPWIPKSIAKCTKDIIWGIQDCDKINIIRTGMIENSQWKNLAKNFA